ncbi:MAG: hypothetical protein HYZ29_27605 [Myxococcales bacterium]|nr:hypothetical protein [Myxococcales bacterium]
MTIRGLVGCGCTLLLATASARADVAPPPRAKITLELTVEGQSSVPQLKLFVTNCHEEPEKSVLDPNEPLVCNPERGPVRVFGFRESDLIELFSKIRADAGRDESAKFLAAKAKTCGEVADQDLNFRDVNVTLVQARYSVEKRDKDNCRLKRISATTKTRSDLQAESKPAPPPASSAPIPPRPATPSPSPSSEIAVSRSSSCSCDLAPSRASGLGLTPLALLGLAALARRPRRSGELNRKIRRGD